MCEEAGVTVTPHTSAYAGLPWHPESRVGAIMQQWHACGYTTAGHTSCTHRVRMRLRVCASTLVEWLAAPCFPARIFGRMDRVRAMMKWLAASLTMNKSTEVLIEGLLGL